MFKTTVRTALYATLGLLLASQSYVAGHETNARSNAQVASVPGPPLPNPWEVAA